MQIDRIDRATANMISSRIERTLAKLGEELGVEFRTSGGTYASTELDVRVKGRIAGLDPAQTEEGKAWAWNAPMFGLVKDGVGRRFTWGGDEFEVTGWKTSRPKFPVLARRVLDGREFKFTPRMLVQAGLGDRT